MNYCLRLINPFHHHEYIKRPTTTTSLHSTYGPLPHSNGRHCHQYNFGLSFLYSRCHESCNFFPHTLVADPLVFVRSSTVGASMTDCPGKFRV